MALAPKKRFSQNFLINKNICRRIVALLQIKDDDVIFEIGPGQGALTGLLAESGATVYAFELDNDLIEPLRQKFADKENVNIIPMDFLKVIPAEYHPGHFKLIGNIPYDITSPLIDWIIFNRHKIDLAVITVQKELAERISSKPGTKNWAPIAIFAQCYFHIKKAFNISPGAFFPPPKIHSTTLVFMPHGEYSLAHEEFFADLVRLSFRHRRKLLLNNLSEWAGLKKADIHEAINALGYDSNIRAEQISLPGFITLAETLWILKNS